jgi:hypothetical protein
MVKDTELEQILEILLMRRARGDESLPVVPEQLDEHLARHNQKVLSGRPAGRRTPPARRRRQRWCPGCPAAVSRPVFFASRQASTACSARPCRPPVPQLGDALLDAVICCQPGRVTAVALVASSLVGNGRRLEPRHVGSPTPRSVWLDRDQVVYERISAAK